MRLNPEAREAVLDRLLALVQGHPQGIKEYDLLQECRKAGLPFIEEGSLLDSLVLYRVHFLLFHFLYLLRERLLRERQGDLEIHCLSIKIKPWPGENCAIPSLADTLTGYYMDLDRVENITRQEADDMIQGFWSRYSRWDERKDALATLELQDPVDDEEITRRFRQLAMIHHPDRGGDGEKFRQIAHAMDVLR